MIGWLTLSRNYCGEGLDTGTAQADLCTLRRGIISTPLRLSELQLATLNFWPLNLQRCCQRKDCHSLPGINWHLKQQLTTMNESLID